MHAIALTRDGSQCAVGGNDHKVIVYDVRQNVIQTVLSYDCHVTGNAYIWALAFSPSDNRLAVGSWNGHVYVYRNELQPVAEAASDGWRSEARRAEDLCARRQINELACLVEDRTPLNDAVPRVYSLAMTQLGDRLLVGGRDSLPTLYDISALADEEDAARPSTCPSTVPSAMPSVAPSASASPNVWPSPPRNAVPNPHGEPSGDPNDAPLGTSAADAGTSSNDPQPAARDGAGAVAPPPSMLRRPGGVPSTACTSSDRTRAPSHAATPSR